MHTGFRRVNPKEKSFGRPRLRFEDNIKIYVKGTECEGVEWIRPAYNREKWRAVVNTVMNLRFSKK
jgi:hypothetical protein